MKTLAYIIFLMVFVGSTSAQQIMNLAGEWQFKLDPENVGIEEEWFLKAPFTDIVRLPGCLQEQGFGNIPNVDTKWWNQQDIHKEFDQRPWMAKYKDDLNFKYWEFLIPDRHYIGVAWYSMDVIIPEAWSEKKIDLFLERCHWESKLWLNGVFQGQNQSLGTPHVYPLKMLSPGKHRIVLRIDNSQIVSLGGKPHSVSEQTAGTWNGIVGKLQLTAQPLINIDDVQIFPDIANQLVTIKGNIQNHTPNLSKKWVMNIDVSGINGNNHSPDSKKINGEIDSDETPFEFYFPMGNEMMLWDEFNPDLYEMTLTLVLDSGEEAIESTSKHQFGMRHFSVSGRSFLMNGKKTFLRGNVDCAVFPATGYAPMDVVYWKRLWQIYKSFGLNMARFHSWCPPEAAFIAADEIGIYLAPEVGEWVRVNKQDQFDFLEKESLSILKKYGNHPSFIQLGEGNEAGGDKDFFKQLIETWKAYDSRHVYTIKANSNSNPENIDYEVVRGAGEPFEKIRYQNGWPPKPLNSSFQSDKPGTMINWNKGVLNRHIPLIQHETAQICAYPDLINEITRYNGYLNPNYLDIALDQLHERGMFDQLSEFIEASGKWQIELTKEEFEAAYRTKDLAGFHWLCLADFTGQNTAPVGFTDAFYNTKSYVSPASVRLWNGPTVLLAEMEKRVFASLDEFNANIMVSHFGKEKINLSVSAKLQDEKGKIIQSWTLPQKNIDCGNAQQLGQISASEHKIDEPTHLILTINCDTNDLTNSWDIWIFPKTKIADIPKSITVAQKWNDDVKARLEKGKTVLLLPKQNDLKGQLPICFTNYYWTSFGENKGQSSATGILIDTNHPVFRNFATKNHANWQWWDMLTMAHPMILDSYDSKNPWPKSYKPIIQPIDTWKINRKLALLTEVKIGKGKLIICSIDLETDLENRPVANQFRTNLLKYIDSNDFNPSTEVGINTMIELFEVKKEKQQ